MLVAASLAMPLGVVERSAEACSPPAPEPVEECLQVRLVAPAGAFPIELADHMVLTHYQRDAWGYHSGVPFDGERSVLVHRQTDTGYQAVDFELTAEPELQDYARRLALIDPVVGSYVVSTQDPHCDDDEPGPVEGGTVIGRFQLEPSAPLPDQLGTVRWLGQQTIEDTVGLGIDSECNEVEADVERVESIFELDLSAQARPWASVTDVALYVDGELFRGYARLPSAQADGTYRFDVSLLCNSSEPELLDDNRLDPGTYDLQLKARVEPLATVDSNLVNFALTCGAPKDAPTTDPVGDGGCSAAGSGGRAWWLIAAGLVLIAVLRRR